MAAVANQDGMKQEDLEMEWLAPDRFMQPVERRRVRYLLRQKSRISDEERQLADENRMTPALREKFRAKWRAAHDKLGVLAADMLKRYLGIGRYSVLRIKQPNERETLLQVLRTDVTFHDWNHRWLWCVHGRRLRKNGTLGFADAFTCFDIADVRRRQLDGTWQCVWPVGGTDERA